MTKGNIRAIAAKMKERSILRRNLCALQLPFPSFCLCFFFGFLFGDWLAENWTLIMQDSRCATAATAATSAKYVEKNRNYSKLFSWFCPSFHSTFHPARSLSLTAQRKVFHFFFFLFFFAPLPIIIVLSSCECEECHGRHISSHKGDEEAEGEGKIVIRPSRVRTNGRTEI